MTVDIGADLARLTAQQRQELLRRLRQRRRSRDAAGQPPTAGPEARAEAETRAGTGTRDGAPGTGASAGPVEGPLATAQERLWFVDQLDPGNPAYAIPFALRITGPLDPGALERAVNAVVRRHDALRAAFPLRDGRPRQVVRPDLHVDLAVTDLSHLPPAEREEQARRLATDHAGHRFDLATGPLVAVRLLRLAPERHLLLVSVHHIVFDGWSTSVFQSELAAHYRAAVTGAPAEVPALRTSYLAWAAHERAEAGGAAVADDLAYWRGRLADAPARSTLPTDLPRPARQRHRGAQRSFTVPGELTDALVEFARREGTTLNVVVLAAFAALLGHASRRDDLLLGTPVAGRTRAEVEPLIGCFANTLVIRVDLGGDPSARALVRRVHQSLGEAYAHQRAPYASVVEAVAPPRDPGHNPLFQVMVSVAAIPEPPLAAGEVDFTPEPVRSGATDFDLFCTLTHRDGGGLDGVLGYDTDLFFPATVDAVADRLVAVLGDLVARPDTAVDELPSLRRHRVAVAASFTADPVGEPLRFWCDLLRLPVDLRIAPYGQVLPELIGGAPADATVCLIRWEDWLRHLDPLDPDAAAVALDAVMDDLDQALRGFRERGGAPLVVGVCPPSERFRRQPWARLLARLDERLGASCRRLSDVTVVPPEVWTRHYPVVSVHDPHADSLGHVPYTPTFFAALGTYLARLLTRRWAPPVSWVAVDSTVAPHGPAAPPERLAAQARHGRRLTVAVAGQDLVELVATEGGAGAGCLLLTGDPATAARARSRLPAATVVTVPEADAAELDRFLAHLWPLDPPAPAGAGPAALLDAERLSYLATRMRTAQAVERRCRPPAPPVPAADRPATPPRTATERRLAEMWHRLLPAAGTDVRQDFFAAGGHSILAVRLLSQVERELGRHLPLHQFFAAPTIEGLATALDGAVEPPEPIPVRPGDGEPALSSTQRRLWTIARLGDDPSRHNVTFAAVLRGRLDVPALRRAVDEIVRRHEVLRTTFPERDGAPSLVVHERMDCWLAVRDLSGRPESDRARSLADERERHARRECDLDTGPLLWVRLVRTGAREHHLLVGMHHIVSDNWSWGVFLRELATCYEAFARGGSPDLPPLPVQFTDYATWQAGRHAEVERRHGEYWRARLANSPPLLALPTDHPRPAVRSDRAGRASRTFAAELGTRLRQVAADEGTTLFAAALAGYATLLARLSGQEDLVVGTPVSGRDRPELGGLIGYFADLLPLRLELSGEPTFRELARRCHTTAAEAYAHQELGFGGIVTALRPARDPAYHPVFQCVLNLVDGPELAPELPGLAVEPVEVPPSGTDFDLFLTLAWQGDELCATLDYRADLYRPETADRLLAGLETVLAAGSADPDRPVRELDLGAARSLAGGAAARPASGVPVGVAASFTVEPLADAARYWLERIGIPARLEFGPYGQVLPRLLDPESGFGDHPGGVAVVLLRWEDWLRRHDLDGGFPQAASLLDAQVRELARAVRTFRGRSSTPLVLCVCPASVRYREPPWSALFAGLSSRLSDLLADCPDTEVARFDVAVGRYPLAELDDPVADELGHVPYTPEGFAALGTLLAREVHRWRGRRVRTVLVDPAVAGRPELARLLHRQRRLGRAVEPVTATEAGDECVLLTEPTAAERTRAAHPRALLVTVPPDPDPDLVPGLLDHVWTGVPGGPDPVIDPAEALRLAVAARRGSRADGAAPRTPGARQGAAPRTDRERVLAEIWADLLHLDRVGIDEPFWELGGDSMVAIQVVSRAARAGIGITPRHLLEHPTIETLAAAATELGGGAAGRAGGAVAVGAEPADGAGAGPAPLTGAQRWFFAELAPRLPEPAHFNHPYDLVLRRPVEARHLAEALTALARHHGSLRLRFQQDGQEWRQEYGPADEPVPYAYHDLSGLPAADQDRRVAELAAEHQAGLHLTDGPLVRAVHFGLGPDRPDRLLIVNHHLVVDAMSRGFLLEDLESLCDQLADGRAPRLPARSTPYLEWAARLDALLRAGRFDAELDFWCRQGAGEARVPVDYGDGRTTYGSSRTVRAALTGPRTAAVRAAARRLGMNVSDLLLTATAAALADWTGDPRVGLAVAGHGRPDLMPEVDLSRTVGWFQVYYPLRLEVPVGPRLAEAVRAQVGRVPHGGVGYGLLRYGHPDPSVRARLAGLVPAQVTFNYMGDFGFAATPHASARFDVAEEIAGPPQDERGTWPYLLDVVPSVVGGRLVVEVNYSDQVHRRQTVERFADGLMARLTQLVREAGEHGLTDPATERNQRHAG